MSTKTYKTIELPSGSGELRHAGKHLAKVFYHLQVRQAITADDCTAGQAEVPATLEIVGEVSISQDEPNQAQVLNAMSSGELLTLHLADGRRLEVHATKGDALSGAYRIVAASPTDFVSQ